MKIITSGFSYLDIDAYGGIIAYAELLTKQGITARALSTAPLNESVTKTLRSWPVVLDTHYTPSADDTFTLIDISEPEYFEKFVDTDRIDTIIDHHPGYEAYWQERIGSGTIIEPIGAACTQVYECWKRAGLLDQMSTTSVRLLICGILDNTLNFGAQITTPRDKVAYDDLMRRADLPDNWPEVYFGEVQASIDSDPVGAIKNDTKNVDGLFSQTQSIRIGQCAVWDASAVLNTYQLDLQAAFDAGGSEWFINVISIGERKSHFLCANGPVQEWLSRLLDLKFNNNLATSDRLWLRKEIIKQAMTHQNRNTA